MSFGLTNAPVHFMYLINSIFMPELVKFVMVFIDDILSTLRMKKSMSNTFVLFCNSFCDHQLYTKFSRCAFWLKKAPFLGHVISAEGITVDPSKVQEVLD
jgi:hypothetical protein